MFLYWRSQKIQIRKAEPLKIGLVDLERMTSVSEGFLGDCFGNPGLMDCVSKDQIDIVAEVACKYEIPEWQLNIAKENRLKELDFDDKLEIFHQNKKITGKELLDVDIEKLGLNLDDHSKSYVYGKSMNLTLREFTTTIIKEINRQLEQKPEEASVKGKRSVCLVTCKGVLYRYAWCGVNSPEESGWIALVIQALIDKGHLFALVKNYSDTYYLQA